MPPGPPRLQHALLILLFCIVVTAQQQQSQQQRQHSPQQNAVLEPSPPRQNNGNLEGVHNGKIRDVRIQHGKDTAQASAFVESNERALATFAPDGLAPSVRARPARPSGGLSRQTARSLQDWQVEDIILLATVDGKIYARERVSGALRWELEVDHPMVQTTYHKNTSKFESQGNASEDRKNTSEGSTTTSDGEDLLWIVEPSQDGALYVYSPDAPSGTGMSRLGLSVKQLVDGLSPYAGEDPPVVYTAEKKNTLYTIDASTGHIVKMFSSAGSVTNTDRSCRKVNALEMLDDLECEPMGTLTLGRTEYIVSIQDKETGRPICTISYFEWGPNNRDRDLQSQYATTLDGRYVYSKYDGRIIGLEHRGQSSDRRFSASQQILYSHKFSSPVVRVFDVVRPQTDGVGDTDPNLVVLPQPLAPLGQDWSSPDNVFVNYTESGSWYALSEQSYPLVTDGAATALVYHDNIFKPQHEKDGLLGTERSKLVGVHPLVHVDAGPKHFPAIGGPEEIYGLPAPEEPLPIEETALIRQSQSPWSTLR